LEHVFDEYTQLHLDDVAFFPSESGFDYDAFITSSDQPSILHLDLESGRVSITEGDLSSADNTLLTTGVDLSRIFEG